MKAKPREKYKWLIVALIFGATLSAYWPAIRAGYIWDDDAYVINNETLRSAKGLYQIWFDWRATPQYYPLVHTTYWIEYHLWQLAPAGYHVVNILLHGLSAVLLWRLLRYLAVPGALLAGLFFALHPIEVESVAWITERKNVLAGVFFFAAMLAYLHFNDSFDKSESSTKRWQWYALSFGLFIFALLSKTVTCALPAVLLLIEWYRVGRFHCRKIVPLIPFFALGAIMGCITVWLEKHHVRAQGQEWALTLVERFLPAGRAVVFYLQKIVWPANLTFVYPRWNITAENHWLFLFPIAVIVVIAGLWLARRFCGRGPLTAFLCYLLCLFPALGFFDVYPMRYSFVADHFQYFAGAAILALAAVLITKAIHRTSPKTRQQLTIVPVIILIALGVLTNRQCTIYQNLEILWTDTIRKNDQAWMAHLNLGVYYDGENQYDRAVQCYLRAIDINPDSAEAHKNLARRYYHRKDFSRAEEHYLKVLQLEPQDFITRNNLGMLYKATGDITNALVCYEDAIKEFSEMYVAMNNIAWIRAVSPDEKFRDPKQALHWATQACELAPHPDAAFLDTLAAAYAANANFEQAVQTAEIAHELAVASHLEDDAEAILHRIELYKNHQAYYE